MAFEGLSDRLQNAMTSVSRKGKITEADLKQMMREVRLALLEDVYKRQPVVFQETLPKIWDV